MTCKILSCGLLRLVSRFWALRLRRGGARLGAWNIRPVF